MNVNAYASNGFLAGTFATMADAVRYAVGNRLGADWATPALPDDPSDEDRHLLAAFLCHRALRPQWRHAQFDLLMQGRISCLPDQDWRGLEDVSVLAMQEMFDRAGIKGWTAVSGHIDGLKRVEEHVWLQHQDGRILDAFPPFGGHDPYLFLGIADKGDHGYRAGETIETARRPLPLDVPCHKELFTIFPEPRMHAEGERMEDVYAF